jgi:radical SAM protein with 4Fe4S-binding SPASM domain
LSKGVERVPDLMDALTDRTAKARVPLYATAELTWRCNFRCVHCYQEGLRGRHRELSTDEWKKLLDELAELGTLFLTLTGGEPFVRRDTLEIYRHAVESGFLVTVFTNGAHLGPEVLALWAKLPPRKVEITLYGMSPETYELVTGRADGFARAMGAVSAISALGIRLELKVPVMRPLLGDLPAMQAFADSRGLPLRTDTSLFPRLDGNPAPLAHRLSPAEVVAFRGSDGGFQAELDACFGTPRDIGDKVYVCGAGSNALNVDPSGHIEPCVIARGQSIDWRTTGTRSAWAALAPEAARTHTDASGCGTCASRGGCSRCPGLSWMETGGIEGRVDHHCELTALKLKILGKAA